jgi:hypothetical protein
VPVKKVQQIPIQRVPDKTVAATPERKAKPTTETLIVAPSVDNKAAQSGPAPVDRTTSTTQPPVKAQAPASGSAMDKAFEFPIEEEVDAIQKTETPTARAESQTVTLEDFEPGHPPTKADKADKADKPATATPASRQGRRAIVVGPDHPSTELKRRQSSVRPVDLIKSVESEIKDSMFVTTDRATDSDQAASTDPAADSASKSESSASKKDWRPSGSNPFLKDRNKSNNLTAENRVTKPVSAEETDLPVPEQIKKLRETIANFARPVVKPPEDESDSDSF